MKRQLTFIMLLACTVLSAQNINEVLQYSNENLQGTARFQGMSGAFGALGGDLSAVGINPAGAAVFKNSLITFTGTNYNTDNESLYFNSTNTRNANFFNINQAGGVFVLKSTDDNTGWKKVAIAINYDLAQNFSNAFVARGNTTEGIDNYFLNFAQGTALGPLLLQDGEFIEDAYLDIGADLGFGSQQAFLGYFGGVIDPVDVNDNDNTAYTSNAQYTSVEQDYVQRTSGFNSKITATLASQYQENLYLGASINYHNVLYEKVTLLSESGYDATSPIQFTNFDNLLKTVGYGFSVGVGAIAKLNDNIRVGGSYQSPTWYTLTDDTSQRINSDLADNDINLIDFNIVNLFESYKIKTPGKLTGSAAIVFGKQGLLSFDYGYQDFSQAELRPNNDPNFADENTRIANLLGAVSSYRIGGEYRIEQFSLRGGYRYEESPYEDGSTIGDLEGFSAGIGYDFGSSRLDLAYSRSEQERSETLFTGLSNTALLNAVNTNITLGYTVNF